MRTRQPKTTAELAAICGVGPTAITFFALRSIEATGIAYMYSVLLDDYAATVTLTKCTCSDVCPYNKNDGVFYSHDTGIKSALLVKRTVERNRNLCRRL